MIRDALLTQLIPWMLVHAVEMIAESSIQIALRDKWWSSQVDIRQMQEKIGLRTFSVATVRSTRNVNASILKLLTLEHLILSPIDPLK